FRNLVDQADVDVNVPWMDPENQEADRMRTRAAAVVGSLSDLAPVRKQAIHRRAQIEHQVARRSPTVGWLAREPEGWRVGTGSVLPPRGTLWVVMPGEASRGVWRQVGALDQAQPKLTLVEDPAVAEGRPVFATTADQDADGS